MLYSGPSGNLVIFSAPFLFSTRISCSRYPPAPGSPSGIKIIGSIETTMPGFKTVSTSHEIQVYLLVNNKDLKDQMNVHSQKSDDEDSQVLKINYLV